MRSAVLASVLTVDAAVVLDEVAERHGLTPHGRVDVVPRPPRARAPSRSGEGGGRRGEGGGQRGRGRGSGEGGGRRGEGGGRRGRGEAWPVGEWNGRMGGASGGETGDGEACGSGSLGRGLDTGSGQWALGSVADRQCCGSGREEVSSLITRDVGLGWLGYCQWLRHSTLLQG